MELGRQAMEQPSPFRRDSTGQRAGECRKITTPHVNEAWIACRLQTLDTVARDPAALDVLLDAASGYIFGHLLVLDEIHPLRRHSRSS